MNIPARLRLAIGILVVVALFGTAGFHFLEGWTWFDGFYMTLTTMATVGYGEIHPLSHLGRIFNSFLIVAAVIGAGFTIATFSQALLEFEFGKLFGRRRMEHELAKLTGHYIICGAGRVGRTVARELRDRGESCVIIEKDPVRARWAEERKDSGDRRQRLQRGRPGQSKNRPGRRVRRRGQFRRRKPLHHSDGPRIPVRPENHRPRQRRGSDLETTAGPAPPRSFRRISSSGAASRTCSFVPTFSILSTPPSATSGWTSKSEKSGFPSNPAWSAKIWPTP